MPIIAMTADTVEEVHKKCLDAGMNDYVSKPINIHELYAAIKKQIDTINI